MSSCWYVFSQRAFCTEMHCTQHISLDLPLFSCSIIEKSFTFLKTNVVRLNGSGTTLLSITRIGATLNALSINASSQIVVCGNFGVAVLNTTASSVTWSASPVGGTKVGTYHGCETTAAVVTPDFSQRVLWTVFTAQDTVHSSGATAISARNGNVAILANLNTGEMITSTNALHSRKPSTGTNVSLAA